MVYSNRLTEVVIEEPVDGSMRHTRVVKRFKVSKGCAGHFEEELGMQQFLRVISIRFRPESGKTLWKRLNVVRTFWRYCRRLANVKRVLRLTHATHERSRMIAMGNEAGFKWARDHAIRTAVLFGCPFILQGFLTRRFMLRAQRRQAKINAAHPPKQEQIAPTA